MRYTVLLLDDDSDILTINSKYLCKAGYNVTTFTDPLEALKKIPQLNPDIVISDRMMPGMDGMTFCNKLHALYDIPLIFLTGKVAEDDRVDGLLNGADDYMIKPYSLKELDARIQVVLKRKEKKNTDILDFTPLIINTRDHKVYYEKEEIPLSKREYEFLILLVSSPGRMFTFEEIGKHLFGSFLNPDRGSIMVYASRLRKKIELYSGADNIIETIRSQGYQFIKPH